MRHPRAKARINDRGKDGLYNRVHAGDNGGLVLVACCASVKAGPNVGPELRHTPQPERITL